MPRDVPTPTAEGTLIRRARQRYRPKIAMADAASKAGISVDNWGHIERGYQSTGRGQPPRPVIPPADTLAHMANALDITPDELVAINRHDAADILRDLRQRATTPAVAARKPSAGNGSARQLLDLLRERAAAEDRSLGEVLVLEGLADPEELVIPDAMPPDPIIEEINASDISDETKAKLIRLHLDNRTRRFEEERMERQKPDG